jgi:putative redox protein
LREHAAEKWLHRRRGCDHQLRRRLIAGCGGGEPFFAAPPASAINRYMVDSQTETPNAYPQVLSVRSHTFRADVGASLGSTDSAPGPHDYFDAALAACKTLTATWYAKKNGIPLERVEAHVERNDSEERKGKYVLKLRLAFHGPLSDEDRTRLHAAVAKCPVHKLMTTTDVVIETST